MIVRVRIDCQTDVIALSLPHDLGTMKAQNPFGGVRVPETPVTVSSVIGVFCSTECLINSAEGLAD